MADGAVVAEAVAGWAGVGPLIRRGSPTVKAAFGAAARPAPPGLDRGAPTAPAGRTAGRLTPARSTRGPTPQRQRLAELGSGPRC